MPLIRLAKMTIAGIEGVVTLEKASYEDGRLAMRLWDEDANLLAVLSVNLGDASQQLEDDEFYVQLWGDNQGLEILLNSRWFAVVGHKELNTTNYGSIPVWRLRYPDADMRQFARIEFGIGEAENSPFDPTLMQMRAQELIRAGRMPSLDEFTRVVDEAKQNCAPTFKQSSRDEDEDFPGSQ